MDLITDLPPVEGYNSILVVVDQGLLKRVILCPCTKTLTWEGAAIFLEDNLFKGFGLPDEMISDKDPRFAAHAFQELLKLLNICSNLTTAYHPQFVTFSPYFTFTPPYLLYNYLIPLVQGHMAIHAALS